MRSREYKYLLMMKIKKYQWKTPNLEYFQMYMHNYKKFNLKNVRSFLIKD